MKLKAPAYVDYETFKIGSRPKENPPKPVGCAIEEPNKRPRYYAWGHPCENNCTLAEFKKVIKRVSKSYRCVYHHAKFDMEVSEKYFSIRIPDYNNYECTLLLAYLRNPRERDLKLKRLADKWLDMPPDEQTKLRDWIIDNVPKATESTWGEYIAYAPGKLVGKYAIGDIIRTKKLFKLFMPYITAQRMADAYITEKKILPIILRMEQQGVPIDVRRLKKDLTGAYALQEKAMKAVCRKLGVKEFNPGAPTEVIPLFEEAGLVHPDDWQLTEKGNIRIGIDQLAIACNNKSVVKNMRIHSKLVKLIGTYMEPWLESAEENGVFYPWFNQTRGTNDRGTKSGRFSSNFQQTPKEPSKEFSMLPFMRNYVVGDSKQHIILRRDFCQQEVRVLAYYENGDLFIAYVKNPRLDVHKLVGQLIQTRSGIIMTRDPVKTCNFLIIYGGGAPALQSQLNIPLKECRKILKAHSKALPGVKDLRDDIDDIIKDGLPIYTAGHREYYAEPGFEYRMLNMLIQGSSADHAKRAMIRIDDAFKTVEDTRILVTVHDEFIVSTPYTSPKDKKMIMTLFRDAMDDDDLFKPIPMISDGKWGKSWGDAVKCPI